MIDVLPTLPEVTWDVVLDGDGYSAEASAERELSMDEVAAFETASARLRPVVRVGVDREIRGMATVDDTTLWVYVHALGPGPCDDSVAGEAQGMLVDLWRTIHMSAAQA